MTAVSTSRKQVLAFALSLTLFSMIGVAGAVSSPEPGRGLFQSTPCPPGSTPTPTPATATATPCPTLATTPATPTPTATSRLPQCDDGLDNDADGQIDHPADPGCQNPQDDTEADGATTTPTPTPTPTATGPPACSDNVDNDGDGKVDHPADPGCDNPQDTTEDDLPAAPQCSDQADNDGDGRVDHPDDPGCAAADDDDERNEVRIGSRVSIRHTLSPRHRFKGRVSSGRARCERGRRVVVKKIRAGRDLVVGRDTTSRRGRWAVPHRTGGSGRYYARARRKAFETPRAIVTCRAARSVTVRARR